MNIATAAPKLCVFVCDYHGHAVGRPLPGEGKHAGTLVILLLFFSAPESKKKPLSTLISQVFVYRFEPGSFLPPWSGLSVTVIKVWFTLRMSAPESISR